MRTPLRIQTLWIGDRLSRLEQVCLASFAYHGHPVDLYVYDDIQGVPDGVTLRDANEIIPHEQIFTYFNGSYAGFADLFRWQMLYDRGGCWIDADMLCIREFDFEAPIVFGREIDLAKNIPWTAAVGVLIFPQGHEVCAYMADRCRQPHRIDRFDGPKQIGQKLYRRYVSGNIVPVGWGSAGGPIGFCHAMHKFNLHQYEVPTTVFYPVSGAHWESPFDQTYAESYQLFQATRGVHLWNEILRRSDFDKDAPYQPGSLMDYYEKLYMPQVQRMAA
ncbi:hypothetical protein AB1L30_13205 [Bremerella sp. JC817]|uniref:hypothetical protein n=1 Tax=Bremerella sp. JC817 TaxID=3231756 RepID=UPI00345B2134